MKFEFTGIPTVKCYHIKFEFTGSYHIRFEFTGIGRLELSY